MGTWKEKAAIKRAELLKLIPDIKKILQERECKVSEACTEVGVSPTEWKTYYTKEEQLEIRALGLRKPNISNNTSKINDPIKLKIVDIIDVPNFARQNLRMSPIIEKNLQKSKEFLSREEIKAQIIAVMSNMDCDLIEFVKGLDMRTGKLVERQRLTQDQANILDYHLMHLYLDYQKI